MRTKIIATVGPACQDFCVFQQMIDSGLDYIRINTAYGDYRQYDQFLDNLKKAQKDKEVKVILDIKENQPLEYLKENNLELVALSFAETVDQIKAVEEIAPEAKIISKIESQKGIDNFDEILAASWGIMVARGDLGFAVPLEQLPCLQKKLTGKAVLLDKFLVVATEMLLSMVEKPEPTRAEVSDVANAIYDGASALMLSEETAIGKYPVQAVDYMRRIITYTESCLLC
jgi:pyruvate kinase